MPVLTDLMVKPVGYHLDFSPVWCRQVQLRPLVLLATVVPEGVQLGIIVNGERCADISGTASAVTAVDGAMLGVFRMPKPVVVNNGDDLSFHLEFETGVLWNSHDYQEHPKGVLLAWYGVNTVDVP
jgi:hypothetical protein